VALPVVAATPALAKEVRLVTRDEIMAAFRFYDNMELNAEDLNLRYQILVDMLFETNPDHLRARLQQLVDARNGKMVLVDRDTGQVAPYDPSMYDELGNLKQMVDHGQRAIDEHLAPLTQQLDEATRIDAGVVPPFKPKRRFKLFDLPRPKLRYRFAAWMMGWRT